MSTYFKTRVRPKGQITLPGEIRELLDLKEGDDLAFSVNEQGQVVVNRLDVIPPDQAWFWSERWQTMEREVDEHVRRGETSVHEDAGALLRHLDAVRHSG